MFIRVQRPKTDENGVIIGGSASVVASSYDKDAVSGHSRQTVVERLGRVIELAADKKSGIFLSPTRGAVLYNAVDNTFSPVDGDDPRISKITEIPEDRRRATFGNVYLLTQLLERTGMISVLSEVFAERQDYERLLLHVVHGFLRDNSSKKCSTMVEQSVLGFLTRDVAVSTLRSDTRYYENMGGDEVKTSFFKSFVSVMRRQKPDFGIGCYIDSTPLPNDIRHDNPYNRLRCQHGQGCSEQIRLALVIDEDTGLPLWYELLPGNTMDMNTVATITRRVQDTLGVETVAYVLDAGYVSKEVIQLLAASDSGKTLITRMPHRKGYPYKSLYHRIKGSLSQAKYNCFRKGCVYFGKRYALTLFDTDLFAYVMIDRERALREYERYVEEHELEYKEHSDSEKIWDSVRFGYFVLLSNIETTAQDMLCRYLDRVQIEEVFKDSKTFEGLLPLAKWTAQTVRGKIMSDMIDTIIRILLLKQLPKYTGSLMDLFYDASSLDCCRSPDQWIRIETPNKQAKAAFRTFDEPLPGVLNMNQWTAKLYPRWV